MQPTRSRVGRRAVIVAAGVGVVCGAYLLPRVAQAVTRRADPLSIHAAASAFLAPSSRGGLFASARTFSPGAQPLVAVPGKVRYTTPVKPPTPVFGYYRSGPPTGLSFY